VREVVHEPVGAHDAGVGGEERADRRHVGLEGAHLRLRKVRYVTFRPGDEIDEAPLLAFTRDAARIAALPREARLALALDRD